MKWRICRRIKAVYLEKMPISRSDNLYAPKNALCGLLGLIIRHLCGLVESLYTAS
jgi:hypothetical protein